MAYCHEHAIPHSRFLGGPDEWTDTDRAKVLAFSLERAGRCSSCGTAGWEWEQDEHAYTVTEDMCRGCYLRAVAAEQRRASTSNTPGVTLVLTPRARHAEPAPGRGRRR